MELENHDSAKLKWGKVEREWGVERVNRWECSGDDNDESCVMSMQACGRESGRVRMRGIGGGPGL